MIRVSAAATDIRVPSGICVPSRSRSPAVSVSKRVVMSVRTPWSECVHSHSPYPAALRTCDPEYRTGRRGTAVHSMLIAGVRVRSKVCT